MLEYDVVAARQNAHGSIARCKGAEVPLDTDLNGRSDAFNPVEMLLAAIAACMIKSIERVVPLIGFSFAVSRSVFVPFGKTVRQSSR